MKSYNVLDGVSYSYKLYYKSCGNDYRQVQGVPSPLKFLPSVTEM
jgi:hypothetical protein